MSAADSNPDHTLLNNLETLAALCTPVWYKGEGCTGDFLFARAKPFPTHAFPTLAAAVEEFGRQIDTPSISSPGHHAGFRAGLTGKPYSPHGAQERWEYGIGFIKGLLRAREQHACGAPEASELP